MATPCPNHLMVRKLKVSLGEWFLKSINCHARTVKEPPLWLIMTKRCSSFNVIQADSRKMFLRQRLQEVLNYLLMVAQSGSEIWCAGKQMTSMHDKATNLLSSHVACYRTRNSCFFVFQGFESSERRKGACETFFTRLNIEENIPTV